AAVGDHRRAMALAHRLTPKDLEPSFPRGDFFRCAAVTFGAEPLRPIGGRGDSGSKQEDRQRTKPGHVFLLRINFRSLKTSEVWTLRPASYSKSAAAGRIASRCLPRGQCASTC